jgi:large subunit ribosomal protein L25
VLLRDVQFHPYKQLVLHIDFQRVDAKTKLHMKVPLHFSGAEESPAVKADKCTVNHVVNWKCLPAGRPARVHRGGPEGLKKGVSLHLNDIKLPKGVSAVTHGNKNPVLVSVVAPVEEEVAPALAAAPAAPAKKGKK